MSRGTGGAAAGLPLLHGRDLDAALAWRNGRAISARRFLRAAQRLAEQLPAEGRAINLCQDRLNFALALVAALWRGQVSLMPPNAMPGTLRQLPADPRPAYALVDDRALDLGGLPYWVVPEAAGALDGDAGETEVGLGMTAGPITEGAPRNPAALAEPPRFAADLESVCLLTSGSTGAPQPHAKRWGALVANIGAEAERLAELLQRPSLAGLTLVATVPPQHSYGFESSVMLALLGGAAFDAGRPFYPADIAATLARLPRPRALVTTPFHLKALLLSGVALPPVDLVLSATAPLSPQLAAQAETAMQARLVEIYGCTEAGQVAARRTTEGQTWTTLGALRISQQQTAGGAADAPRDLFVVQGGHVLEPTPLADVLVLHDARRFQLLGRANDLIHVAGKRSSLAHLNFHLNRIDGVEDGAFWLPEPGLPGAGDDTEAVVRTVAFVVAPRLTAAQIIAALRREIEPAFVPRRVVFVPALPREATGKLTAGALRDFALHHLRPGRADPGAAVHASGGVKADAVAANDPAADIDRYDIDAQHPSFAGHFPGQPVLPGVVLMSLVMRSLQRRPALAALLRADAQGAAPTIEQVKFLAPVGPGAQVEVQLRASGRGVAFECRAGDRVVARGLLGGARA